MTSLNVLVHLFIKRTGIRKLWQRFNRGSWQFIYKSTTDLIHPCHSITVVNYEITVAENGKQLLQHVFLQKTHTIKVFILSVHAIFLGHASLQSGSKPVWFLLVFVSFHLITDTACYPGLSESPLSLRPAQWLRSTGK